MPDKCEALVRARDAHGSEVHALQGFGDRGSSGLDWSAGEGVGLSFGKRQSAQAVGEGTAEEGGSRVAGDEWGAPRSAIGTTEAEPCCHLLSVGVRALGAAPKPQ